MVRRRLVEFDPAYAPVNGAGLLWDGNLQEWVPDGAGSGSVGDPMAWRGGFAGLPYATEVANDAPDLWYRFNVDPGDGNEFKNDGSYQTSIYGDLRKQSGTHTLVDPGGPPGGWRSVNNTSGYMRTINPGSGAGLPLQPTTAFTMEAWVKVTASGGGIMSWYHNTHIPCFMGFGSAVGNASGSKAWVGRYHGTTGWKGAISAAATPTGVWVHYVGVWDSVAQELRLYENGVLVAQAEDTDGPYTAGGNTGMVVSGIWTPAAPGVPGEIAEPAYYRNKALTADRVLAHYNSGMAVPDPYAVGDVVRHADASWVCLNAETAGEPGASADWALLSADTAEAGGGGAVVLDDLTDVDTVTTPPTDAQALVWDDAQSLWVPGDVAAGGGGGGGGGGTFSGARIGGSGTQSAPNATFTVVTLFPATVGGQLADFDTDDYYATPDRLTIPAAGFYAFGASVEFVGLGTSKTAILTFRVNGGATQSHWFRMNAGPDETLRTSWVRKFEAGDYIEFIAYHDHGGSINLNGARSEAWIHRLDGGGGGGGGAASPAKMGLVRASTNPTLPASVWTKLAYDTVLSDDEGWWDAATSEWVIPEDGTYLLTHTDQSSGDLHMRFRLNGAENDSVLPGRSRGHNDAVSQSLVAKLTAGDRVSAWGHQASGAMSSAVSSSFSIAQLTTGGGGAGHTHPVEADTDWHVVGDPGEPAFENGWVNYGSVHASAAFRKDAEGFVHLRGLVKSGSMEAAIFTLPAGYRPAGTDGVDGKLVVGTLSASAAGRVDINPSGGVYATAPSVSTWIALDSISFFAEQ